MQNNLAGPNSLYGYGYMPNGFSGQTVQNFNHYMQNNSSYYNGFTAQAVQRNGMTQQQQADISQDGRN